MDKLAFGFWGVYFGTATLMLAGSALGFSRSLHRISLNAGLSATASSFFVIAFLGGLPIEDEDTLARVLAHIAMLVSGFLAYLLFSILGLLRGRKGRLQTRLALTVLVLGVIAAGWLLPPVPSLALGLGFAWTLGVVALAVSLRSAYRGDRLAWTAVLGVFFMLVAMLGLGWIALVRGQEAWPVHAVSALAGTAYLVTMAAALWTRYSYLIELHQVMALGPSYDPVTRMRSHTETGQMVGDIFRRGREEPTGSDAAGTPDADEAGEAGEVGAAADPAPMAPRRSGTVVGVMVVSIGNLYALERLHGMAAVNHALFVCAGRLRRAVPAYVEMGRFSADGFVLLLRDCKDSGQLIRLAHEVEARLSKSVVLNTSLDAARRESEQTRWRAEIGVGVLLVSDPVARASSVLAACKAMSRTAMSYASRVAWLDQTSGEAVELPVLEAA
ncbi:GGDEF domain-containing protein [Polaromonas sp.]|uniref:GGDEF domain-containing protein n=1 Tax=Polaromonas sp. TaxID=1869339 RepID=UPI002487765B|nr:GGDEF domain-containing protein [Polaromonas sp.]MDI1342244.1 GGDEF domain-containing protein [Polaromonas sp.]